MATTVATLQHAFNLLFQKKLLEVDGIIGEKTLHELKKTEKILSITLDITDEPEIISSIKKIEKELNYKINTIIPKTKVKRNLKYFLGSVKNKNFKNLRNIFKNHIDVGLCIEAGKKSFFHLNKCK